MPRERVISEESSGERTGAFRQSELAQVCSGPEGSLASSASTPQRIARRQRRLRPLFFEERPAGTIAWLVGLGYQARLIFLSFREDKITSRCTHRLGGTYERTIASNTGLGRGHVPYSHLGQRNACAPQAFPV